MRILKHAFLSIMRKPTKGITLFTILLVVFALVFTGIIIQNSIGQSKTFIRKELGGNVNLRADYMKAMNEQLSQEESMAKLSLPLNLADALSKDPLVEKTYIQKMSSGSSDVLKSAAQEGSGLIMSASNTIGNGTMLMLVGNNQDIPADFTSGNLKLSQGRHRTPADTGKNTALISEALASKNNLAIGDEIQLKSNEKNETITFEVIGIFSGGSAFLADQLFVSNDSIDQLSSGEFDNVSGISWLLKDPLDIPAFIENHKNQMPSEYLYLDASDEQYKQLTRPLNIMSTITSLLLAVVFIAGALILIAIVTLFIRDRQFEIGLLLSSGETKFNIFLQFALEIMIVATIAFLVAAGASQLSSGVTANWIAENQLVSEEQTSDSMGMSISFGDTGTKVVSMDQVANAFDVSIGVGVFMQIVLSSLGLLLFSVSAPLMVILGYKPRTSLQN